MRSWCETRADASLCRDHRAGARRSIALYRPLDGAGTRPAGLADRGVDAGADRRWRGMAVEAWRYLCVPAPPDAVDWGYAYLQPGFHMEHGPGGTGHHGKVSASLCEAGDPPP